MYENFHYTSGGHGGPYPTFVAALTHAMRYLNGAPSSPNDMEVIKPYFEHGALLGETENFQLIRERHNCACKLCEFNGSIFYHFRVVRGLRF